jgi:hypothetical protein
MNALKYAHLIGRHVKMNLDITLFDAEDAPDGCGVVESVYDWHDGSAVEVNFTNKQTVTILPGDADRWRFWISDPASVHLPAGEDMPPPDTTLTGRRRET